MNFSTLNPTVGTISKCFCSSGLKWLSTVVFPELSKPTTSTLHSHLFKPRKLANLSKNPILIIMRSRTHSDTFSQLKELTLAPEQWFTVTLKFIVISMHLIRYYINLLRYWAGFGFWYYQFSRIMISLFIIGIPILEILKPFNFLYDFKLVNAKITKLSISLHLITWNVFVVKLKIYDYFCFLGKIHIENACSLIADSLSNCDDRKLRSILSILYETNHSDHNAQIVFTPRNLHKWWLEK